MPVGVHRGLGRILRVRRRVSARPVVGRRALAEAEARGGAADRDRAQAALRRVRRGGRSPRPAPTGNVGGGRCRAGRGALRGGDGRVRAAGRRPAGGGAVVCAAAAMEPGERLVVDAARARKLAVRIREIVASTLELQVKDPRLGMVTITDARVSPDLREATVFYLSLIHISEPTRLGMISYAVFCLKKKKKYSKK